MLLFYEQVDHAALRLDIEARNTAALRRRSKQSADNTARIGRNLQRQCSQHMRHPLERLLVGGEGVGVLLRETGEFGLRPRRADAEFQIVAFEREEVADRPLDDPPAALVQPHVGDHLVSQQADSIACGRIAEARMELLGHAGPADHSTTLEHTDLQPCSYQVKGTHKAVVTTADDYGVITLRQSRPCWSRDGASSAAWL